MSTALISYTTHSKHLNYGATLHGYALQQYLSARGMESTVVDYIPAELEGYSIGWPVCNARFLWRRPLLMVRYFLRWLISTAANRRKLCKFRKFLTENMRCTDRVYREKDLLDGALTESGFDTFVCESDVIWKKRRNRPLDRGFILDFPAAKKARRVAYAPSLASESLPSDEEARFREAILQFAAVSCREKSGAEYVSRLIGREVPWLLDPTLLLSASDYEKIAVRPKESGYVLLYTCMRFNRQMVREARKFAARQGKKLIEIGNYGVNRIVFGHKVVDDAGIEEWLGYFMNADAVICNSFHGICFSLVFGKPFFVFSRGKGDRRFENICEALGLEDRLLAADGVIPTDRDTLDFGPVNERLVPLKELAQSFVRQNIVRECE